jgi:hypothetical protein
MFAPNRPIIWMTTLLHILFGMVLVLIPEQVARVTSIAPYSRNPELFGLMFLASAALATSAVVHEMTTHSVNAWTFWAMIPQQMLLFISAGSVIFFVSQSHYASGTELPAWFIFTDQFIVILLALFHPFGVIRMHAAILPDSGAVATGGQGGQGGRGGSGGASATGEPGSPGLPGEPGLPGRPWHDG